MITLVFVRTPSLFGAAIRAATWSRWNHVAFEVAGRWLSATLDAGVSVQRPDPSALAARFRAPVPAAAIRAALQQLGKPYDLAGVLGVGLHRDWRDPGAWFCSELVAWACETAGAPLLRADRLGRITPGQLAMSPLLEPAP